MIKILLIWKRSDNMGQRHKVFISYHHKDVGEVSEFINKFNLVCITRALGAGMDQDIIDSRDTDYVMRRIRELYLKDTTVSIVLIGECTWTRRYIDWEIQASLRNKNPNGLVGIVLPSAAKNPRAPDRLNKNLGNYGYAKWYVYPKSEYELSNIIEEAFQARYNKKNNIINPRERFKYNKKCP